MRIEGKVIEETECRGKIIEETECRGKDNTRKRVWRIHKMSGLLEKNKDVGESKDIGLKGETGNNRDCECVHERERVRVLVRVHGCASGRERDRT